MSILYTFNQGNIVNSILISLVSIIVLYFARPIWLPQEYLKASIRKLSLILGFGVISTYSIFQTYIYSFIKAYFPEYAQPFSMNILLTLFVLTFILSMIWIVNYFNRDYTAMGIHKDPIDDFVAEGLIKERINSVVESLTDDLRSIDIKTNWSIRNFVPLDADVEVRDGNRKKKKITNILDAIQKSEDRLFLVLGDPGSGKSVSLRKLARELAKEVDKTGKIPVYINLKEWEYKNLDHLPTVENIKEFVLQNFKNRDIVISKFFDKYFDRLYEEGRLYFIFDSFDEIPMLLNENENSELIHHFSEIFFKFLKGARANTSQGVLSSRIFRKPTAEFQVNPGLCNRDPITP